MNFRISKQCRMILSGLTVLSLAACGGGGGGAEPDNQAPVINTLSASPNPININTATTVNWNITDADGDTVSCSLDVDNVGGDEYSYSDCSNVTSQSHMYTTPGTYRLRLNADDGNGGLADKTVDIVVNNTPDAPVINLFEVNPNPVIANSPTTFSWSVSDPNQDTLTCSLDVDGDQNMDYVINNCATNTTQTHTYTTAGTYSARLLVEDGNGGTATETIQTITVQPVVGFDVDVSVDRTTVAAGERVHYSVTLANADSLPMDDVTVQLNVPNGLSFHQVLNAEPNVNSGCGSSCFPGSAPTWTLGSIASGTSQTIDIDALVANTMSDGDIITLPIRISRTGFNDLIINKELLVENAPLAEVNLSATTDPIIAGQTFTYHVDLGNISAGTLTSVQMRTSLPAGLSIVSITDGGNVVNTGEVVWDVASLNVQSGLRRSVTVMADANLSAGQVLKASTELTYNGGTIENTSEHTLTVVGDAIPLKMDLAVIEGPVAPGERLQYDLTLSNPGNLPVDSISLIMRVPQEINFHQVLYAEPNVDSGCGSSCFPSQEARWDIGTLQAGESRTITVDALVAASVVEGRLIRTPIRVEAANQNDTVELLKVTRVAQPEANLVVSTSAEPIIPGETFTYDVDVGNISAGTLTNLLLRTYLPAGVSVVSISDGGNEVNPGEILWNVASLNVQSGLQRQVTVVADNTLVAGQALFTETLLHHDGGMEVDNTADHVVTVVANEIALNVDLAVDEGPVAPGERLQYDLTLSNPTNLPVDGISLIMRVPDEIIFHQVLHSEPNVDSGCGSSCFPRHEARWDIGTLLAGESRTISVDALVAASVAEGQLIVTPIRIEATNQNDTVEIFKVIQVGQPLAELAMSASTDSVIPGETFTYTVEVGNISAGTLTNLEVRTFLPSAVSIDSIANGGVEVNPGEIVWSANALNVASTTQFGVNVTAMASLNGGESLKAHTELRHDDGQQIDNVAEHTVNVVASASPLSVTMSANPDPVVPGGASIYTITISNISALPADAVEMVFRVPDELTFHQVLDAEPDVSVGCGSSCFPRHEARWDLGTIPAGMSQTITIDMNIAATAIPGALIVSPIRVTSSALEDDIDIPFIVSVQ